MPIVIHDADGRRGDPGRTDALLEHRGEHLGGRRGAAERGGHVLQAPRSGAQLLERRGTRLRLIGESRAVSIASAARSAISSASCRSVVV